MATVSATVIDTPAGDKPYQAVYTYGTDVIFKHDVDSVEEGEAWIEYVLYRLKEIADRGPL